MYQPHFAQDNRLVLSQMLNDYAFQCSARRTLVLSQTVKNKPTHTNTHTHTHTHTKRERDYFYYFYH